MAIGGSAAATWQPNAEASNSSMARVPLTPAGDVIPVALAADAERRDHADAGDGDAWPNGRSPNHHGVSIIRGQSESSSVGPSRFRLTCRLAVVAARARLRRRRRAGLRRRPRRRRLALRRARHAAGRRAARRRACSSTRCSSASSRCTTACWRASRSRRAWRRLVSPALERPTYVWVASLLFIAVCLAWRPIAGTVYRIPPPWAWAIGAVQLAGGVLTLDAARRIDVRVLAGLRPEPAQDGDLVARGTYRLVRHPIYLGWVLLVWAASDMTTGPPRLRPRQHHLSRRSPCPSRSDRCGAASARPTTTTAARSAGASSRACTDGSRLLRHRPRLRPRRAPDRHRQRARPAAARRRPSWCGPRWRRGCSRAACAPRCASSRVPVDTGAIQRGSLDVDIPATLAAAQAFYADADAWIAREAAFLASAGRPPGRGRHPAAADGGGAAGRRAGHRHLELHLGLDLRGLRRAAAGARAGRVAARRTTRRPTKAGACRCTAASPASRRCATCRSWRASPASRATWSAPPWGCRRTGRWCWCRSAATAPAASTCTPPPRRCAAWPTSSPRRTTRSRPATASTGSTRRRCTASGSATRTWSAPSTSSPASRATGSSRSAPPTRTALLYTDRGRFCEYDVLVREMPALLDAAFIGQDDLLAGRWREPVVVAAGAAAAAGGAGRGRGHGGRRGSRIWLD